MAHGTASSSQAGIDASTRAQLFLASCIALIATSMIFSIRGDIMGSWETFFQTDKATIGAAIAPAFTGFAISILIGGQLCDWLGMRAILGLAFLAHLVGVILTILAKDINMLATATLIIGFGNGFVEAGVNPLVATIYPDQKTKKLNALHAWWPGGMIIGGVAAYLLGLAGMSWQIKMSVILIPMVIYGVMFLRLKLPVTERVASGISTGSMYKEMLRPLFLIFLFCMLLTASTELGTNQWISELMGDKAAMTGILFLVWIHIFMIIGRLYAGPLVEKLNPVGLLIASALISAVGLWLMAAANTKVTAFAASFVFSVGICYFWPTMLGVTAERFPKGGALLLGLMGAAGMLAAGFAQPWLGGLYDQHGASGALMRVIPLPLVVLVVFLAIFIADKAKGGYKIEKLGADQVVEEGQGAEAPVR